MRHNETNQYPIIRARALANVALVKYFGKRSIQLNLPAAPSLSVTLEPLCTKTTVQLCNQQDTDEVLLNGKDAPDSFKKRVTNFLDIIRAKAASDAKVKVHTSNAFPTAAGLASSASGFAALTIAAVRAFDLTLDGKSLSALARRGSGSAARSVPGGICIWHKGTREDGADSYAESIASSKDIDIRLVVGVTDPGPKKVGSTQAMEQTRHSSPYFPSWIETVERDVNDAINAVQSRDLDRLGQIAENNALAMHAAAIASRPGILFWNGTTVEAIHLCRRLRDQGVSAYFTCDAGPQPKIITSSKDESIVSKALSDLKGVTKIIRCQIGAGAHVEC